MTSPLHRPLFALVSLVAGVTLAAGAPVPQEMATAEILQRSVEFHDPQGHWSSGSFRIELVGTRPLAGPTFSTIIIDNAAGRFHLQRERLGRMVESTVTGDECWTRLDGSSEYSEQEEQRFGLGCDAMRRTRDYHLYLYGLPMKLRDPGARLEPSASRVRFQGRDVWQARVTYDPEVGSDIWYFYFDPDSFALVGYRFFHDESANDGEYIVLDRVAEGGELRLPKVRAWYRNDDDTLLGTDTVKAIERLSRDR